MTAGLKGDSFPLRAQFAPPSTKGRTRLTLGRASFSLSMVETCCCEHLFSHGASHIPLSPLMGGMGLVLENLHRSFWN